MARTVNDLNIIYIISFLDLFGVGLSFPLFSNHLRDLGASHFTIGLISSLYSGLQVLSGPLIGSWSDVRDRKTVLLVTLLLSSFFYGLLGFTNSLLVISILRFFLGITKHTQSIAKAVITDVLPVGERAGAFGRSAAFGSVGFIAGPLLGGHVSEMQNGFSYACYITAALCLVNLVLTLQLTNSYEKPKGKSSRVEGYFYTRIKREFSNSISDITDINWGALWDSFLMRFLFGLSMTMYFSQQSVYLKEHFNISQRHIGYTISYFSTIGTVCAFLIGYVTKYLYKKDDNCMKRLLHSFMLMTVSLVCLFFSPSIEMFLFFLAPFSISCTMLRIVSMELLLRKSENTHRGSLSGSSNSVMSIARFITPVMTGVTSDIFGSHSTTILAALPPLVGTFVCFSMRIRDQKLKLKSQ